MDSSRENLEHPAAVRRRRGGVLEGYFGLGNAGDDAFCVVASRRLAPNERWEVVARPQLLPSLPYPIRPVLPARHHRGVDRAVAAAVKLRGRTVVHLGGSTFWRLSARRADELHMLRARAIRAHAVAVSVGPFGSTTAETEVRELLRRFDSISVRDGRSYEVVRSWGIDTPLLRSFDCAVGLGGVVDGSDRDVGRAPIGPPRIGVCMRTLDRADSSDRSATVDEHQPLTALVEVLRSATDTLGGAEIVLLSFNRHPELGDASLLSHLAREAHSAGLKTARIPYEGDPGNLLAEVARCDVVVTMRLHGAVFAHSAGTPFMLLDYHQKCTDFADEVGLERQLLVDPLLPAPPDHAAALVEAVTAQRTTSASLAMHRELVAEAWRHFDAHRS